MGGRCSKRAGCFPWASAVIDRRYRRSSVTVVTTWLPLVRFAHPDNTGTPVAVRATRRRLPSRFSALIQSDTAAQEGGKLNRVVTGEWSGCTAARDSGGARNPGHRLIHDNAVSATQETVIFRLGPAVTYWTDLIWASAARISTRAWLEGSPFASSSSAELMSRVARRNWL